MVFSIALHFLRNRAAAEELAQDVFLELYLHRSELHTTDHARNWLRKVACRRCIDHSRRGKLRPRVGLGEAPEPHDSYRFPDPLVSRHLADRIAGLSEAARMVVILRYQEDLDPADIAGLLDMPLATVKSHLQRSLATLRIELEALR